MAGVSSTNKELFIVETAEPFSKLEIQFVPGQVKNTREARLQNIHVIGRNDDLLHYVGGAETLSLELDFYAQDSDMADVFKAVNWLKSLTMNNGNAGKFRNVKLIFGDLFKYQVWAIKKVDSTMSHLSQEHKWLPLRAKVSLQLMLDPEKIRFIDDVRNGR